jgi:hypothetical protein
MKIEKNIPVPEGRGRKRSITYVDLMRQMEIGDSFLAERGKMGSIQSAVRQAANRAGIKITARLEGEKDDQRLRVWRIENEIESAEENDDDAAGS